VTTPPPDDWKRAIGTTVAVRVTPKAAANRIVPSTTDTGALLLKIYITTPPEDGKANAAVLKILAKALGIAKSRLRIISGEKSKHKVISLDT
jgi:hypothetical protein